MTLHLYMHHQCSEEECNCIYIPYNESIVCPKCGSKPDIDEYPEFIEGCCESLLFNINDIGSFMPICWATIDMSDTLQMFLFHTLRLWTKGMEDHEPQTRTKAFEEFLDEILENVDYNNSGYMLKYLREFTLTIYDEFFNVRGIHLEITDGELKVVK